MLSGLMDFPGGTTDLYYWNASDPWSGQDLERYEGQDETAQGSSTRCYKDSDVL